jgi:outer membrane protein TolC
MKGYVLAVLAISSSVPSGAGTTLAPTGYLEQVRSQNGSLRGLEAGGIAALERAREADLLTAPVAFAGARVGDDGKPMTPPLFSYDRVDFKNYEAGVRGQNAYGTEVSLSYALDYTSFRDPSIRGILATYYDGSPKLSLSQSLWKNRFGRTTRATQRMIAAEGAAGRHESEYGIDGALVEAEMAYWRLSAARKAVEIQEDALRQAQAILDYVTTRERRSLGDHGDVLQAQALVESRRLEVRAARDEESSAERRFNLLRNFPETNVTEALSPIEDAMVLFLRPPAGSPTREDVKAAEKKAEAASAHAEILSSENDPDVKIYGSYAMNRRDVRLGETLGNSASSDNPTRYVGVQVSMPLSFRAVRESARGARRQSEASAVAYAQKVDDQKREWTDLTRRFGDAQERLKLAQIMEQVQADKLSYERKRLREGRTTTYQVLMFEQDHSQSQLLRLRTALEVVSLNAQMKLYSPATEEARP